jgi:hypothetical protein
VTHTPFVTLYNQTFLTTPQLLASMQTFNAADPANVRLKSLNAKRFSPFIEEERSLDNEVSHIGETVGFFAFRFVAPRPIDGGGSDAAQLAAAPASEFGGGPQTELRANASSPTQPAALPAPTRSVVVAAADRSTAHGKIAAKSAASSLVVAGDGTRPSQPTGGDGWSLQTVDRSSRIGFQWYW